MLCLVGFCNKYNAADLVYKKRSPFYRQLVEIPIKKLDKVIAIAFLKRRFACVKMEATDAIVGKIATLSDGYPDYMQRLGLELYLLIRTWALDSRGKSR